MKVLIVGGGGREHALAWKIARDRPEVELFQNAGVHHGQRRTRVDQGADGDAAGDGEAHRVEHVAARFRHADLYLDDGSTARAVRFAAADWRDGEKLNRDKLASAVSAVLARRLSAKAVSSAWNATTGKLKLTFKRPNQLVPALELTDTIEVTGLVSADKPGASDKLMLWIGSPVITTADESAGPRLSLSDESSGEEEGDQKDDNGSVDALAKELKGQRWDADKSIWK